MTSTNASPSNSNPRMITIRKTTPRKRTHPFRDPFFCPDDSSVEWICLFTRNHLPKNRHKITLIIVPASENLKPPLRPDFLVGLTRRDVACNVSTVYLPFRDFQNPGEPGVIKTIFRLGSIIRSSPDNFHHAIFASAKVHISENSSISFAVGLPTPCPARVSIRISAGDSLSCACCNAAANLKLCAGKTRSS